MSDDWSHGVCSVHGVSLHYLRTGGDGPPLVVAHGLYDDGSCRTPLIRELEDSYDVIAYDSRGHGRSDAPEAGYTVADRVADLVGLLDALAIESPILWGHSMGANTAAATAAAYPDRVRALVLVDPAGLLEFDRSATERAAHTREQIAFWHAHDRAELLEVDDGIRQYPDAGETELTSLLAAARLRVTPNIAAIQRHGYRDPQMTYPAIQSPTLILRADVDAETRARDNELAARLANGRLVHVEDTGHTVVRDARSETTRLMWAFLDSIDA
jgi:pimeloyl-ACP methyl ester carboxylesterase